MNGHDPNEAVSAFVDGELRGPARDRIVGALYGDPELRRAWERFHLIGDAVRKTGPVPGAGSIAGKVGKALSGDRIVPFNPRPRRLGVGPLSGLALAAAVAAVAILTVSGLDGGDAGQRPAAGAPPHEAAVDPVTAVAAVEPPAAGASLRKAVAADPAMRDVIVEAPALRPVAAVAVRPPRHEASRLRWSDAAPGAEARLNSYLVNYNEYAGHGVRGVLPYVRIVGYQSGAEY